MRFRWVAVVVMCGVVLVGCRSEVSLPPLVALPTPTGLVSASPSPTPSPSPTESANKAAAGAAAMKFLQVKDRLKADPNYPIQESQNVAIGQAAALLSREILDSFRARGIRMAGTMEYRNMEVPEPAETGGVLQTIVTYCADSTKADFVDANGKPYATDRPMTFIAQLTVSQRPGGIWLATYYTNRSQSC